MTTRPLIQPEEEARFWGRRVVSALLGAMILWIYVEPPFVMAGILWRQFLGGFTSYLLLSSALLAAVPAAAWFAAGAYGAAKPLESARWCSWAVAILLAAHWASASLFRPEIEGYSAFGFVQFINAGAWAGAVGGFFAGFAYEPAARLDRRPAPARERLLNAALGAAGLGLLWSLMGAFLEFSWRRTTPDPDVHLYFALFLLLGGPFLCTGLAQVLGDERPDLAAAASIPPTFLALYLVLGGSAALVDPSRADALIGRLHELGLAQGLACGGLTGLFFRRGSGRRGAS